MAATTPAVLGLGGGLRWLLAWWLKRREEHDEKMMQRFEGMAARFLIALEKANERAERSRSEHLADAKTYAEKLGEVASLLERLPTPSQG
jgi:hypothetical protein